MHTHIVPAEAPEDLGSQPQRLPQRFADGLGVALGDDRPAVELRNEREESPVVHVHRDAQPTQLPCECERERVGEVLESRLAAARGMWVFSATPEIVIDRRPPANALITSIEMPASFGVHGPGEITIAPGARSRI